MTDRAQLVDRYRNLSSRHSSGALTIFDRAANGPIHSEAQLAAVTRHGTPALLEDLARQLDEAETRILAREEQEARWREQDAQRERARQPLTEADPEFQEAQRRAEEARKAHEYRTSAVGRLEAIEGLLERIATALETRQ
jgi:hypothetical protein